VGQDVDAPSMCHCDADFARTVSGSHVYGDIEHRDECVVSLDRESLVTLVHAADESLQSIDFRQPPENCLLFSLGKGLLDSLGLDLLADPRPLDCISKMVELESDIG
jgi:hypothetical protein